MSRYLGTVTNTQHTFIEYTITVLVVTCFRLFKCLLSLSAICQLYREYLHLFEENLDIFKEQTNVTPTIGGGLVILTLEMGFQSISDVRLVF